MAWFEGIRRVWRTKRWLKWAVYCLPVLGGLVLLGPALGVLGQILKLAVGLLLPLTRSPGGRFLLVNLAVVLVVLVVYWKGRARVASVVACVAMRHFLRGMELLVGGFPRRAARSFRRVIRIARWVNLGAALPAYPDMAADARVRLAFCHIRAGEGDQALRWLELAKKERPGGEVMKRLRELRALAYFHHPALARETREKELEEAYRRDPGNPRLGRAMVEKFRAEGDHARVRELLRRIHDAAEGKDRKREALRLLEHVHDRARALRDAGELGRARSLLCEAQAVARDCEAVQLLLGDVELERQSAEAALGAWGRVPGPAARARVAAVLSRFEDPREVLRRYPEPDVLIDLAHRLLERGAHDQARRTLAKARELGADEVEIEKVLGDLAVSASEPMRARTHYLRAITRMFGGRLMADV